MSAWRRLLHQSAVAVQGSRHRAVHGAPDCDSRGHAHVIRRLNGIPYHLVHRVNFRENSQEFSDLRLAMNSNPGGPESAAITNQLETQ